MLNYELLALVVARTAAVSIPDPCVYAPIFTQIDFYTESINFQRNIKSKASRPINTLEK